MSILARRTRRPVSPPPAADLSPLTFLAVSHQHGEASLARAPDGSVYVFGSAGPGEPPSAWRDTPSGDRQWIARGVPREVALEACATAARAHARGTGIAVMDWPMRDGGEVRQLRTAVMVRRNSWGLAFEPLSHGSPGLTVHSQRLKSLLQGEAHLQVEGGRSRFARESKLLAALVAATRQAPGVLTPGERLRAGAMLVRCSSPPDAEASSRAALRNGLEHLCDVLANHLDGRIPAVEEEISEMRRTVNGLVRGPASAAMGAAGRAFLAHELAPAIARLHGELRARAEAEDEMAQARRAPGYAAA